MKQRIPFLEQEGWPRPRGRGGQKDAKPPYSSRSGPFFYKVRFADIYKERAYRRDR